MLTAISNASQSRAMLPVHAPTDIEYLVKESEVITGQAGRKFVIFGADRLAYRIQWHPIGYKVQRLDGADNTLSTEFLLASELQTHSVGEALRIGQLFTPAVGR